LLLPGQNFEFFVPLGPTSFRRGTLLLPGLCRFFCVTTRRLTLFYDLPRLFDLRLFILD
jgi:hypothetical protein